RGAEPRVGSEPDRESNRQHRKRLSGGRPLCRHLPAKGGHGVIDPFIYEDAITASERTLRSFSGLWGLVLFAVAARALIRGATLEGVLLALGALSVSVAGIVRPAAVRPLFVGAMVITAPLRLVLSAVLLCTVYYVVLTPLGMAARLIGRVALAR